MLSYAAKPRAPLPRAACMVSRPPAGYADSGPHPHEQGTTKLPEIAKKSTNESPDLPEAAHPVCLSGFQRSKQSITICLVTKLIRVKGAVGSKSLRAEHSPASPLDNC